MTTTLVLGANTVINNDKPTIAITSPLHFGQTVGMIWLPLADDRTAKISPAYLHEPKDWAVFTDGAWQLDLPYVFGQGVARLQLVIYTYHDPNLAIPATEIAGVSVKVDGAIHYDVPIHERHIKTALVLEIYERNGQYKCRALAECSSLTLSAFGERLQIGLNEKFPDQSGQISRRPVAGETWTGTAFAIDNHHLLTCHHVIDGASVIGIRQQGQADRQAFVVMSDVGSDTALIRVNDPLPSALSLGVGQLELLGEQVVTLGFPLSGVSSQLQVTAGNIAGVLGMGDDIRFLQFTAPIQPGSSGSPLLLLTGQVIGMVTSSLTNAQNMNYAVKYQLLSALLTSSGVMGNHTSHEPLTTPQLIKRHKEALWLVGASA